LTEATHIFLLDPINGSQEKVKATEDQAIGRAHRLGQKKQVRVFRMIIKDTIEEDIYNDSYVKSDYSYSKFNKKKLSVSI